MYLQLYVEGNASEDYHDKQVLSLDNLSEALKQTINNSTNDSYGRVSRETSDVLSFSASADYKDSDVVEFSHKGNESLKVFDTHPITPREVVLRRCGQTEPISFSLCYPDDSLLKCRKIGEGLYGEVYFYKDVITGDCSVMKIIPIEGNLIVNGEQQKKFSEILSEIIIVMELSNLRLNEINSTCGFSQLKKICCVEGKYPAPLIDLWDLYDEVNGSENDSPVIFGADQLYVVLELGNAGTDLEAFEFNNSKQSLSVFLQTAASLSVAEKALQFEHRDLHWGNVLIDFTAEKNHTFDIGGQSVVIPSNGVKATIIDFTLSRITFDKSALFNDLGADADLFVAEGDYQFDIYRLMKEKNRNNWKNYEPFSNILWLHYLADKMIRAVRYKRPNSKVHKHNLQRLCHIKDSILAYDDVSEFVKDFELFE